MAYLNTLKIAHISHDFQPISYDTSVITLAPHWGHTVRAWRHPKTLAGFDAGSATQTTFSRLSLLTTSYTMITDFKNSKQSICYELFRKSQCDWHKTFLSVRRGLALNGPLLYHAVKSWFAISYNSGLVACDQSRAFKRIFSDVRPAAFLGLCKGGQFTHSGLGAGDAKRPLYASFGRAAVPLSAGGLKYNPVNVFQISM